MGPTACLPPLLPGFWRSAFGDGSYTLGPGHLVQVHFFPHRRNLEQMQGRCAEPILTGFSTGVRSVHPVANEEEEGREAHRSQVTCCQSSAGTAGRCLRYTLHSALLPRLGFQTCLPRALAGATRHCERRGQGSSPSRAGVLSSLEAVVCGEVLLTLVLEQKHGRGPAFNQLPTLNP